MVRNYIALAVLLIWPVVVLLIFSRMPPRRAAIVSTIFGCLFLPNIGLPIPGLPDYTKVVALALSVLLGMVVYDPGRLSGFRPNWFDVPLVVWSVGAFATSLSNGLGLIDGISTGVITLIHWGILYVVGRVYLADSEGMKLFALASMQGALIYLPFCLFESAFGPTWSSTSTGFRESTCRRGLASDSGRWSSLARDWPPGCGCAGWR